MNTTLFKKPAAVLSLIVATLLVVGCASTPAPTLLTLPAAVMGSPAASVPAGVLTGASPVLALARIEVPEYLVSRRVRYRTNDATLAEWPDTYWAERIEVSLSREFVAALRDRLPIWRVCEANCGEMSPALGLRVVLNRMDYTRGDRSLKANVRIVLTSTDRLPRVLHDEERSYEISASADDAQSQARAYADLLSRVAADASGLVVVPAVGVSPGVGAGANPGIGPGPVPRTTAR